MFRWQFDLWLILDDKTGKDERLHFVFDSSYDLTAFLLKWSTYNLKKDSNWILEIKDNE